MKYTTKPTLTEVITVVEDLYNDIFNELYTEATPGIDEIEEIVYPEDVNIPYLHFIEEDEMLEIIEDVCDEYSVSEYDRRAVKRNVVLGKAPSTSLDNVDRAREEAGLQPVSDLLK